MITGYQIKNFKRYQKQEIDLSKQIIILVGPNSSGKSSLIKVLLAFKQTYEDQGDHSGLLSNGEYVDLGPFSEYVRDHDTKSQCRFLFRVQRPRHFSSFAREIRNAVLEFVHELNPQTGHGRLKEFNLFYGEDELSFNNFEGLNEAKNFISYKRMSKSDESYKLTISQSLYAKYLDFLGSRKPANAPRSYGFSAPSYEGVRAALARGDIQSRRVTDLGMSSMLARGGDYTCLNAIRTIENAIVFPFQSSFVEDLTQKTFGLAGIREMPQRSGLRTDETMRVGSKGQNTGSVYFNFHQKAIKAGKREAKVRADYDSLNKWLRDLNLAKSIETSSWRDLVDLRVNVRDGKSTDSIVDLGVGFSQVAPILVQLAVMPERTCLVLEQPELHLYPWAQVELGKLLCDEAKRNNKNIIIETHSEHIIRGIQTHTSRARIYGKSKAIPPSDISILYVDSSGEIIPLEIDEYGEFKKRWPPGFFDQGLEAISELLSNKQKPTFKENDSAEEYGEDALY
jgi:predicted ATPase